MAKNQIKMTNPSHSSIIVRSLRYYYEKGIMQKVAGKKNSKYDQGRLETWVRSDLWKFALSCVELRLVA